ncbi:hypothetical protein HYALB_00007728 [Hymenoscyphus albidus]|uniref:Uncharacterized protein n=1 Tax=Hymenoscyphus albidus TaxID=595503 RepID=A0A9N9LEV8_9HELO|nr:hypothetical protein HYALB_00007728 [Hymenoscyphus albidus]
MANKTYCSGSSTADVEAYQFFDEPTSGVPSWQYGDRPAFGKPDIATLQVGGNNIDFQRQISWDLIKDPKLVENISNTIKKVVERDRKGPIGDRFRLYVPGFAQFFDTTTKECDTVTFARTANPKDDGKEHTRMIQAIRKDFNDMIVGLNKAIEDAVEQNKDQNVKFVSIDEQMK